MIRGSSEFMEVLGDVKNLKENSCCTSSEVVEILKLVELRQISSKLVDIDHALRDIQSPLEDLGECITTTPRGSLLCITGNVTNYDV